LELDRERYLKEQEASSISGFSRKWVEGNPAYYIALCNYLVEDGCENDAEILGQLATAYRVIGNNVNLIKILAQGIAVDPNNELWYFYRGDVHWTNKNYQLAVNDYRQGQRLNPNHKYKTLENKEYEEIDPYNFRVKYVDANSSNRARKFMSTVTFSFNSGPRYFFKSLQGDTDLVLYSSERIDNLRRGQRVTVYFTHSPWGNIGKENVLIAVVQ